MRKIAIIGASYLQMPLVLKAKEFGLETHSFAWEEGAVCKDFVDHFYPVSTLEKDKILDICKGLKIDAVASIASDVAVSTVNYVATMMNLVGNDFSDSELFTNKFRMRERFQEYQIPSPKFMRLNKSMQGPLKIDLKYPLIVKPVDRSGSKGVKKVDGPSDLSDAVNRAREASFIGECIIEELIEGREVSVESISWKGEHFILAVTDKETTGDPYYVELAHHQPSTLNIEIIQKLETITINALRALNINFGASHSEFMITSGKEIYAIEVGARMGGDFIGSDLVFLSTGYDFVKGVIEVSLGNFNKPELNEHKYSGIYFLSKETSYLLPVIQNVQKYEEIVKAEILDKDLHSVQCSADRSGYLIYQSRHKLVIL